MVFSPKNSSFILKSIGLFCIKLCHVGDRPSQKVHLAFIETNAIFYFMHPYYENVSCGNSLVTYRKIWTFVTKARTTCVISNSIFKKLLAEKEGFTAYLDPKDCCILVSFTI